MRAQDKILFELTPYFLKKLGDCKIPPRITTSIGQTQIEISTPHSSAQKRLGQVNCGETL